jgi:hypothetical protein
LSRDEISPSHQSRLQAGGAVDPGGLTRRLTVGWH